MNDEQKIETLKFCINRYDTSYQGINNKISLYITLNSFILTGLTAYSGGIIDQFGTTKNIPILLLTLTIVSSSVSVLFSIIASIPFVKNARHSNYYYGYVSGLSFNDYLDKIKACDCSSTIEDLSAQAHILSQGLKRKFSQLQIAGWLLFADFILITILSLIIVTKN